MTENWRRKLIQAVSIACLGIALAFVLWGSGFLDNWEDRVWDLQSRMLARPSPHTKDIVLVLLDQSSLEWVHDNMGLTWPWPRELYGAIIDTCNRYGARAIAFDTLFTEPSAFGVSDDQALGNSIGKSGHFVVGSVFPSLTSGKYLHWPKSIPPPDLTVERISDRIAFPEFPRATMPIVEVASTSSILCNVHQDPSADGIYRSLYPLVFFQGAPVPALGLGAFLAEQPVNRLLVTDKGLHVGSTSIALDRKGRALLRFRGPPETYQRLSAATLIAEEMAFRNQEVTGETKGNVMTGKYVFFGFSAPGLFDLRPTPMGGIFSGVEINATLLDNLLNNDFIAPLDFTDQGLIIAATLFLAAGILTCMSGPLSLAVVSLFFILAPLFCSFLLFHLGYRMEVLALEWGLAGIIFCAHFLGYMHEGRQRRFIKKSFRHYLSPHVIEQLIAQPDRLRLGGDRKEISIFFSDLQGFTTISEGMEPEDLTHLLNLYLSAMTEIILEEEGTVDKYEGDAIIAFWNAPLEIPDHAQRAVSSALRCQAKLTEMREELCRLCGHELHMRIGINTGQAVVGNLGSGKRFDYTMLGDAVNLAARLEGANKQFGSFTMISSATYEQIHDIYPCRELARLTVVGRQEPVRVFEPYLAEEYQRKAQLLDSFSQGLTAFYAGDLAKAISEFEKIAAYDPPASSYLSRCRGLQHRSLESWTGVWTLTSK